MQRMDADDIDLILILQDISRCFKRLYDDYLCAHVDTIHNTIIISFISNANVIIELNDKTNIEVIDEFYNTVKNMVR